MSRALLDVNVLIAMFDAEHVSHAAAHRWSSHQVEHRWATCALTENAFVRIVSQPAYEHPISIARAFEVLRRNMAAVDHELWPCDVSVLDPAVIDSTRLHGHRQVADAYLLALAVRHDGRFVTFDRSVPLSAVHAAEERHLVVL